MAVFASVLGMDTVNGNTGTLAGTTATAAINVGPGRVIAINTTQDTGILFGNSSVAATASSFRIPANQTFTFSTNNDTAYFSLFNQSATSESYYWTYLSKF